MQSPPPITAAQTQFLASLAEWSGRPFDQFPTSAPPCGGIGGDVEDKTLAAVFVGIAAVTGPGSLSFRLDRLHALVGLHQRHYDAALRCDPTAGDLLAAYSRMIAVIQSWFEAIHQYDAVPA